MIQTHLLDFIDPNVKASREFDLAYLKVAPSSFIHTEFKSLSDDELYKVIFDKAELERRTTAELISFLIECERRKLYAARGFSSLFGFLVEGLKCSESAAMRRVQAARLAKEHREVIDALKKGEVKLTNLSKLGPVLKKLGDKKTFHEKKKLISELGNLPQKELEKKLAELDPKAVPHDSKKQLTKETTLLTFAVDEETMALLEEARSNFSHTDDAKNLGALFKRVLKEHVLKRRKEMGTDPKKEDKKNLILATSEEVSTKDPKSPPLAVVAKRKPLSIVLKRQVLKRDQGCCQYIDPKTHRRCGSKHFLEFDHIKRAREGGQNAFDNLRILCKTHNLYRA